MKKWILLLSALCLLALGTTGCGAAVEEEVYAYAGVRPDHYWKDVWVTEEREINIIPEGEDPDALMKMEVYGRIRYEGEQPANRVRVIIRSPLTFDFIEDHRAMFYGVVQPGDVIEYHLIQYYPDWRERVPIGVYKDHIVEDFRENAYINITWEYDGQAFDEHFFDFKAKEK